MTLVILAGLLTVLLVPVCAIALLAVEAR